ncbi:hypothetical protein CFD26_107011 [Aspergillus turcosus]|uniref:Apple domain-containing protein n=1 Tax=Aspergillus turcosus TaxID=1245748 RepID=A0A421D5W0_9EURO|nr:hypothetical protein CFD26_107011 [Aspergillus turcosus]
MMATINATQVVGTVDTMGDYVDENTMHAPAGCFDGELYYMTIPERNSSTHPEAKCAAVPDPEVKTTERADDMVRQASVVITMYYDVARNFEHPLRYWEILTGRLSYHDWNQILMVKGMPGPDQEVTLDVLCQMATSWVFTFVEFINFLTSMNETNNQSKLGRSGVVPQTVRRGNSRAEPTFFEYRCNTVFANGEVCQYTTTDRCKVATGHDFRLNAIVWIQVSIKDVTRLSESTADLALDARGWLESPSSTIKLVVAIVVNRTQPELVFCRWELYPRNYHLELDLSKIEFPSSATLPTMPMLAGIITKMPHNWPDDGVGEVLGRQHQRYNEPVHSRARDNPPLHPRTSVKKPWQVFHELTGLPYPNTRTESFSATHFFPLNCIPGGQVGSSGYAHSSPSNSIPASQTGTEPTQILAVESVLTRVMQIPRRSVNRCSCAERREQCEKEKSQLRQKWSVALQKCKSDLRQRQGGTAAAAQVLLGQGAVDAAAAQNPNCQDNNWQNMCSSVCEEDTFTFTGAEFKKKCFMRTGMEQEVEVYHCSSLLECLEKDCAPNSNCLGVGWRPWEVGAMVFAPRTIPTSI